MGITNSNIQTEIEADFQKNSRVMIVAHGALNKGIMCYIRNHGIKGYTEFVHSFEAIRGFMLILHNAFSGLLIAFVIVLLVTVFVALSHSIGSTIEADYVNMGILKTMGLTSGDLRRMQLMQYGAAIA